MAGRHSHVVVAGGGVIGAATAFFLAERGHAVTVVERHEVAGAASGKAGGFLALDWCDGTPLAALARRSFQLHADLASRFGNPWDYRCVTTFAAAASARLGLAAVEESLDWLAPQAIVEERLGTLATTAQVHPAAFTKGLLARSGAQLIQACVTGVTTTSGAVSAVQTDHGDVVCDAAVIALGPWTDVARDWLALPPVSSLNGVSLILDNPRELPAHAVFARVETASGELHGPEIFVRPDGTTYACGLPDRRALPTDPVTVAPAAGAEAQLRAILEPLAPTLANAPARAVQACYRPVMQNGLPLVGAVPGVDGAYVATGHSVWGILNAPATGEALAAMIDDAPLPVDLTAFAPERHRA